MFFLTGLLAQAPLLHLLGGGEDTMPAMIADHSLARAADGPWPVLTPVPGADGEGVLLLASPETLRAFDTFAAMLGQTRAEVTLHSDTGTQTALTWTGPAAAEPLAPDWVQTVLPEITAAAAETDWRAPGLDPADLRRQWPMMRARAAARIRAQGEHRPTTLRRASTPDDWSATSARPMAGAFFRLDTMRLGHRRFDGQWQQGLLREVLVGADAALILPYDPVRDRVLLVEQFRTGPARRGDPAPWALEPVAGMVDAGETPEQAAIREAGEEAGLALTPADLRPMFAAYSSPGNATDHFYAFAALTDLPDGMADHGGLDSEAEDIRLHVLPYIRAMELLDSGEVTAVPLVAMLLWLARARESLRA